jgi:hypothetical protein
MPLALKQTLRSFPILNKKKKEKNMGESRRFPETT